MFTAHQLAYDMEPTIGFEQLLSLVNQLSEAEKTKLIETLQNDANTKKSGKRQLGKYEGQIWMSDDFNQPLDEFKDYM